MKHQRVFAGITLLGLGPGDPQMITREAWQWLESIPEIYLRTNHHPVVPYLPEKCIVKSFDHLYVERETFDEVYNAIVDRVLEMGERPEGVTYAVPGHPMVSETTCRAIRTRAYQMNLPVRVIEGISFLEPVFTALNIDPFDGMILLDALEVCQQHHPVFPPSFPAIISQIYSREVASEVKLTLMAQYPDHYPVKLVHKAGTSSELIEEIQLYEIDRTENIGWMSVLYLPQLDLDRSFENFQDVIAMLRAPDGCPWDREQTHSSLRNNLLEETYETLAAIDQEDPEGMKEELGDLLLQIVLHAQIASEYGEFNMSDVIQGISSKIIRRHPHVFAGGEAGGVDRVLSKWEDLKQAERNEKNGKEFKGLLDGVPTTFPALAQAQEYQARAARVGFDWPVIEDVWAKVLEELDELRQAKNLEELEWELGDLLFVMVNLIRWKNLDAESLLRQMNARFRKRFSYIENKVRQSGSSLKELSLHDLDKLWDEAKELEKKTSGKI